MVWLFVGNYDSNAKNVFPGITDSYVSDKLKDVCNHMIERGCSCRPVIHTERKCIGELNKYLATKAMSRPPDVTDAEDREINQK